MLRGVAPCTIAAEEAMRVLLTGADGQFGRDFIRYHGGRFSISPLVEAECDIRREPDVRRAVEFSRPDVVVHAAAFTDVDGSEGRPDEAYGVNALGTRNVARAAESVGARLLAISTDYVFFEPLGRPRHEFDAPSPRGVYACSKRAGEIEALACCGRATVLRTAWLYGGGGRNFPRTILRVAREKEKTGEAFKVVDDQVGNPTSTRALSDLVARVAEDFVPGVVHASCEGEVSWYGFALEILRGSGCRSMPVPCATEEFPRPAPRPLDSRLDKMVLRLTGRAPMPHWTDSLSEWRKEHGI